MLRCVVQLCAVLRCALCCVVIRHRVAIPLGMMHRCSATVQFRHTTKPKAISSAQIVTFKKTTVSRIIIGAWTQSFKFAALPKTTYCCASRLLAHSTECLTLAAHTTHMYSSMLRRPMTKSQHRLRDLGPVALGSVLALLGWV